MWSSARVSVTTSYQSVDETRVCEAVRREMAALRNSQRHVVRGRRQLPAPQHPDQNLNSACMTWTHWCGDLLQRNT